MCGVFNILTSKKTVHHNGLCFFDISASKSETGMVRFSHLTSTCASHHNGVHFFQPLNFQKWNLVCFVHVDSDFFFRTTTACTFSTSELPNVLRARCALCILTSKCGLRHNGVQLLISHPTRWLRTRRFSEPTFRLSGAPRHWIRNFSTFRAPASSFF